MALKYQLSQIGWYNFELLVQTLLKAVIGPGVTSFGGSKDGGRDASFLGRANYPSPTEQWQGRWIFQVKYIDFEGRKEEVARSSIRSAFRTEIEKILQRRNDFDNYVLLTNLPLTATVRDELHHLAIDSGFSNTFAAVDGKEICELLDLHPHIRRSFPQLLGLADLDVVINRDLITRSRSYVEQWQPRLRTYVHTEAHSKALHLIRKGHFAVLDGPPEVGKSTIAAAITLTYASEGYEVVDVRESNDVFRAYVDDRSQLFIADDAVGSVSMDPGRADDWSRDLPGILRKLDEHHILIWTTRRYILEEALSESRIGEAVASFPRAHEVVVEVRALSEIQKAELLYNHAKTSGLSQEHRKLIREKVRIIINHPNFTPERIRQLTEVIMAPPQEGLESPTLRWTDIEKFMNDPGERWIRAYKKLSLSEQALLSAMLDSDRPIDAATLRQSYQRRSNQGEPSPLTYDECVTRLKHSFLTETKTFAGEEVLALQHPSLRDMLLLQLREDASARTRFFSLATPFALAGVIAAIAVTDKAAAEPQHAVIPKSEEEFAVFILRIRQLPSLVPQVREWEQLFSAADRLIPRKDKGLVSFRKRVAEISGRGVTLGAGRFESSSLDLVRFANTWPGQIIKELTLCFASRETFQVSTRYLSRDWLRLLTHHLNLIEYLSPPAIPAYTLDLCQTLHGQSLDALRLANLLREFEPIVVKQSVSSELMESWSEVVAEETSRLIEDGRGLDEYGDPDEYDSWQSETKNLLSAAASFHSWSGLDIFEGVSELQELLTVIGRPNELEGPEYDEEQSPSPGAFWTVERIFEDL